MEEKPRWRIRFFALEVCISSTLPQVRARGRGKGRWRGGLYGGEAVSLPMRCVYATLPNSSR